MQLIECVPNFSEGQDKNIIEAIAKEIETVDKVKLLDVDPGFDTNRTVMTFIGEPEDVKEAAFKAIKKASELIDMSKHKGAHPRIGATDVCPFVPVSGATMDDCIRLANELGEKVAKELNIPIYLYDYAATCPERINLADIRKGEYEGLADKLKDPEWKPDYGTNEFNTRAGATVIGARDFLIAYNVNLNTKDKKLASKIALNIREQGRFKRDDNGKVMLDENGNKLTIPGTLKATKAIGWYIDEYKVAQISINLINHKITPLHKVYEECCEQARQIGVVVTGSELVGMVPKDALIEAGKYYLEKQGKSPGVPESELIFIAIKSMKLDDLKPFDMSKKIIEYTIKPEAQNLADMTVANFIDEVSTESPAPGGGSVAALCGALGSALSSMVANLTVGKKGYEVHYEDLKKSAVICQGIKEKLVTLIDADTDAFNLILAANRMPKNTPEQIHERNEAIQSAYQKAALVPFETMKQSKMALDEILSVSGKGNINSITDVGVAALCAKAGVYGASMNVKINLQGITDKKFIDNLLNQAQAIENEAESITNKVLEIVNKAIEINNCKV